MVCMYDGILLGHKKSEIMPLFCNMDGPRNCHTDWSKSKRERQISYDIARYCLRE